MSKVIIGTVKSDKPNKTIIVNVENKKLHPLYQKRYSFSRRFTVHDEKNEAKVGDKVAIVECRPLSATKRFKLDKIIERAKLSQESLAIAKSEDTGKQISKKTEKVEDK